MRHRFLKFSTIYLLAVGCQTTGSLERHSDTFDCARQIAPVQDYNLSEVTVSGTRFFVFTRKKPVLPNVDFIAPIKTYWPILKDRFGISVHEAAIIDFDEAISGGPLKSFILGIFSSHTVSSEFQTLIESTTGWAHQTSTEAYIKEHYSSFGNPNQAYIDDMIAHELGHLYFGFGIMKVPLKETDWWFPIGLGLLYDRLGWDALHKLPSPLFADTTKQWEKFEKTDVDQHLINPDISRDQKHGLSRRQVYSHAKAWEFLKSVRSAVGPDAFDNYVVNYLRLNKGSEFNYEHFLKSLSWKDRNIAKEQELNFGVR